MVFRNIHISLDDLPAEGYLPGSTISGKVITIADKRIHIKSLTIHIHGVASVRFIDRIRRSRTGVNNFGSRTSVGQGTTTEFETFTGHENYISTTYRIKGETYIELGEQEFAFSVILPSNIPSTFSSQHGSIKYWIAVKMDKAWNFDQEVKVEFLVCAPKDLSRAQGLAVKGNVTRVFNLATEQVYQRTKNFNFFCCSSGPLNVMVAIPKSGVVPGEVLHLTIDANNATNVKITSIKVLIMQEVTYFATFPRRRQKTQDETLLTVHCQEVAPGSGQSWRQPIQIPSIQSINIDECSIMQQQHYIVVQAVPEGMHLNLEVKAPIVIGTLPVGKVDESFVNPFQPPNHPIAQPQPFDQEPPKHPIAQPQPFDQEPSILGIPRPLTLDIGVPPPPYKEKKNLPSPDIGFVPPDIGFVEQSSGIRSNSLTPVFERNEPSAPFDFHSPKALPPYPVSIPHPK